MGFLGKNMERTKPEIKVDIRPTGIESAVIYALFDQALEALTKNGYDIISLAQNAQLRIQQGANSHISRNGNRVREGVIYFPNGKPKLTPNSPILESALQATEAHENREEFYLTSEQVEKALEDSVDFPQENIEIPTNRFAEEALAVYAFGGEKGARVYGEFLRNAGIKKMPVYVVSKDNVNSQSQPFARQMWFGGLDVGSGLSGDVWDLYDGDGLRGVKMDAVGTSPKNSEK